MILQSLLEKVNNDEEGRQFLRDVRKVSNLISLLEVTSSISETTLRNRFSPVSFFLANIVPVRYITKLSQAQC